MQLNKMISLSLSRSFLILDGLMSNSYIIMEVYRFPRALDVHELPRTCMNYRDPGLIKLVVCRSDNSAGDAQTRSPSGRCGLLKHLSIVRLSVTTSFYDNINPIPPLDFSIAFFPSLGYLRTPLANNVSESTAMSVASLPILPRRPH